MVVGSRNNEGLTRSQIARCQATWEVICEGKTIPLDISQGHVPGSKTRFNEDKNLVYLGADSYPGHAADANSRMSVLACLAHERAHFERFQDGY